MFARGASAPVGEGQPLPLVSSDASGKFLVGAEALAVLRSISGPIGVAAVCGRARQGKSFVLNAIARTAGGSSGSSGKGFTVAATHKPCTKGLWLWSAPIPRVAADGTRCVGVEASGTRARFVCATLKRDTRRSYHLLLLDSEGVDAYDQTGARCGLLAFRPASFKPSACTLAGQYSTQVFALAVLLSSLFVYNQLGAIDEAALDRLALVSEVACTLAGKAGDGTAAGDSRPFAPAFLWLLRDFYLDLSEEGRPLTPRDYLETALRSVPGSGAAVASKNQIRRSISTLFPQRDCHALVRPVNDEKALQALDTLPRSALRPEFNAGIDALTASVLSQAGPKRLGGDTLTGCALARLVETYVHALNGGAVPPIASAWEAVAAAECSAAMTAGDAAYDRAFAAAQPPPEAEALSAAHAGALSAGLGAYAAAAVGPHKVRESHQARLKASLERRFGDVRARAFAEASSACAELLAACTSAVAAAARADQASYHGLAQLVESQAQGYAAAARGPHQAEKLATFLRGCIAGPLRDVAASQGGRAAESLRACERRALDSDRAAQQAQAEAQSLRRELQEAKERLTRATQAVAGAERAALEAKDRAAQAAATAQQQAARASDALRESSAAAGDLATLRQRLHEAEQARQAACAQAEAARADARKAVTEAEAAAASARHAGAASLAASGDQARRLRAAEEQAERAVADAAAHKAAAAAAIRAKDESEKAMTARMASWQAEADAVLQAERAKRPRSEPSAAPAAPSAAAGAVSVAPPSPVAASMNIGELKAALVAAGHEAAVFDLAAKKGKKADFVDLYRKHLA